jgi:beta-galactosidase
VKGDIGIVFVPESELFDYAQQRTTAHYLESSHGAYQAFFDSNIQADWVHIDDIGEYKAVYLPYPLMLKPETAKKLIGYVEQGGSLISEGLPAYFGDRGRIGTVQPNYGLDRLFGARETYVEFTPDLLEGLKLRVRGTEIYGHNYLQEYALEGGTVAGTYENGHTAAVENRFGKGKTLLIGTYPGSGYYHHHSPTAKAFFAGLLEWAGLQQQVRVNVAEVKARLHMGAGGTNLWVVNPTREARDVTVTLPRAVENGQDLWIGTPVIVQGKELQVHIGGRDAAVIRLR